MSYKNIVWVKLEKRLLNDHRWFMMNSNSQLLWIKLLLLAAQTYNKIPRNEITLMELVRFDLDIGSFKGCLEEVKKNFHNLKGNKHFYYIEGFENNTNYIPKKEIPGKSPGNPQYLVDKEKDKDKEKKREEKHPALSDSEFIESLKNDPVYKHIDIDFEFKKMDKWFLVNTNRQRTRKFIINWLNKIDKPLEVAKESSLKPADKNCKLCQGTGFVYNQATSTNHICACRRKA